MTNSSLPIIGFDRFIAFEWAEYALRLALLPKNNKTLTLVSANESGKANKAR